jgi:hypothetical protein
VCLCACVCVHILYNQLSACPKFCTSSHRNTNVDSICGIKMGNRSSGEARPSHEASEEHEFPSEEESAESLSYFQMAKIGYEVN